jgi:hypothetical protein
MAELAAELAGEFGAGRISRPYRDVWLYADKSPYKSAIYAILERGGYVRFSAHGLTAGSGYYVMAPDQLARYRHAVDDDSSGHAVTGRDVVPAADGRAASGTPVQLGVSQHDPGGVRADHSELKLDETRSVLSAGGLGVVWFASALRWGIERGLWILGRGAVE